MAAAGAQLYYGQVRTQRTTEFNHLCELISDNSTASSDDVKVVVDGLIRVMQRSMGFIDVIHPLTSPLDNPPWANGSDPSLHRSNTIARSMSICLMLIGGFGSLYRLLM